MNDTKYNKIKLYKENIVKFISNQNNPNNPNINLSKLSDLDYIIGILFLTEMNRYCKNNKISIHGYYLAISFINIFYKIRNKLTNTCNLSNSDINEFYLNLANNVDYLNSRIDSTNHIKNKINYNLSKLIIELNPIFLNLCSFKKRHNIEKEVDLTISTVSNKSSKSNKNGKSNVSVMSNSSTSNDSINSSVKNIDNLVTNRLKDTNNKNNNFNKKLFNSKIYCDTKCYFCWVDNVLVNFFYILLVTAKYMGSGEYKDPNLKKLSEYYSNIFFTYIKLSDCEKIDEIYSFELFDNYIEYKNKLNYSLIELKINSDTVDEIVNYLDNFIIKKLSINNK